MNRKPSIVILDPDPESRAEVLRTLTLANLSVLTEGGHGVEGHTLVAEVQPDCVLLALEPPVERGIQTLEALIASYPEMPVIVYSSVDDGPSVRRAMIAGAADYLSLPVNGRTAAEAIYSVVERAKPQVRTNLSTDLSTGSAAPGAPHAGIVITVFGAKGGIGKTTISTNLAVALASQSHSSVAIVDMDTRFGDVAIMLDASPERSIADAARDVDKLDRMTIRGYMTRHESGVAILPAPTNPTDWDVVSPEQVERIVHLLAQTHDYVILDTPGAFNELVATSLDLATVVLLITSLELASIKDTSVVLSMLRSWSFPEEKVRLTVNHSNLASSVKESDIARTLDYPIFWSIPYDESVMKASQVGKPIVLYQPNSKATNNIMHLASLVGGTPIKVNKPVRAGFFGKLLNFAGARA